jgi:curved DNA-binding protein CbpA
MSAKKNKRLFKRYQYQSEILLSVKDTNYHATITDYSLKGIGFSLDTPPPVTIDSDVHFVIKGMQVEGDGKIIWSHEDNAHFKGGIERKTIYGKLQHFPLADILLDLQRSEKNGILEISSDHIIKKIYVKNGDMVYATSNREEDRFIEILLQTNKLTIDQYYQVLDISKKNGKSHGSVLVELGLLKPEDLILTAREQIEQIIISLFQLGNGKFVFLEGPVVSDKLIKMKLSAANLIFRGIKSIKNITSITRVMPTSDTVLCYSDDPMNLFQDIGLDKMDKDILSLIDGKRSIHDILSGAPFDNLQTIKIIYALINTRLIDTRKKDFSENALCEEILKEQEPEVDPHFIAKVEDLSGKMENMDYYSLLGVEKGATIDRIKKAYYKAAREFHPDRHLQLPSDNLKTRLNALFSHFNEIYKVLSNPEERRKYDSSLSVNPVRLQSSNAERARLKFLEGEEAFRRGAYSEAKELFGQATYLDSSVPAYYFGMGLVYEKERNFSEAGKVISKAVRLDPFNTEYLTALGHVYLRLGFNLRARSTFEKAMKLDPSNRRAAEGLQKIK